MKQKNQLAIILIILLIAYQQFCQETNITDTKLNVFIFSHKNLYIHVINYFQNSEKWQIVNSISQNKSIDFYWYQKQFVDIFKNYDKSEKFRNNIWPQRYSLYNKASLFKLLYNYQKFKRKQNPEFTQVLVQPLTFYFTYFNQFITPSEKQLLKVAKNDPEKIWIAKPVNGRLGQGIFLIRNVTQLMIPRFKNVYKNVSEYDMMIYQGLKRQLQILPQNYIIQEYIQSPLLLEEKKFDMRGYLFIPCFEPLFVVYINGYVKRSMKKFDLSNIRDLSVHLTNNSYQKKLKEYLKQGHNTLWGMTKFLKYLKEQLKLKDFQIDLMFNKLYSKLAFQMEALNYQLKENKKKKKLKQINHNLQFNSQLYGPDIVFDSNLEPYLLEMNLQPMIHYQEQQISPQIQKMIKQFMDMQADIIINKDNLQIFLQNLKQSDLPEELIIIYNEANNFQFRSELEIPEQIQFTEKKELIANSQTNQKEQKKGQVNIQKDIFIGKQSNQMQQYLKALKLNKMNQINGINNNLNFQQSKNLNQEPSNLQQIKATLIQQKKKKKLIKKRFQKKKKVQKQLLEERQPQNEEVKISELEYVKGLSRNDIDSYQDQKQQQLEYIQQLSQDYNVKQRKINKKQTKINKPIEEEDKEYLQQLQQQLIKENDNKISIKQSETNSKDEERINQQKLKQFFNSQRQKNNDL